MKEMKSSHETGGLLTPRGPVGWCYTHTNAQNSPCLVPASHQMAHLFHPSAQRDAGLVVPTDRRPNSPHAPWQAGAVTASPVEDQMLIATRSCLVALLPHFLQKKKSLSVSPLDQETNLMWGALGLSGLQTCFEDCDALHRQSPLWPMFHWQGPLLCHSKRTVLK